MKHKFYEGFIDLLITFQIQITMETLYTSIDYNEVNTNLANIIAINTSDEYGEETEDYDFDCHLDELYKFERYVS